MKTLLASTNPLAAIMLVRRPGTRVHLRYEAGFEHYFNMLPVMENTNYQLAERVHRAKNVLQMLAEDLVANAEWLTDDPGKGQFTRVIVGIEDPETGSMFGDMPNTVNEQSLYVKKEGAEVIVAQWGEGFTSPVHGHTAGYHHEQVLFGTIMNYSYRIVDELRRIARPVLMEIISASEEPFVSKYEMAEDEEENRTKMVHNFRALEASATLHYLNEHSRDGMGNSFEVEYFDEFFNINVENTTRSNPTEMKVGDVAFVRSTNAAGFGDHFIIITGEYDGGIDSIVPHMCIPASGNSAIFDLFEEQDFICLKLTDEMAAAFRQFHDIKSPHQDHSFDDEYDLKFSEVKKQTTEQAMYARVGDVYLVRSSSLPEVGDHYILVTGHPVEKPHGFRPQTLTFPAMKDSPLLDLFDTGNENVILLKLNDNAARAFRDFNNVVIEDNKVYFKTPVVLY